MASGGVQGVNIPANDDDTLSLSTTATLLDLASDDEEDAAWLHDMMVLLGIGTDLHGAQSVVTDSEIDVEDASVSDGWGGFEELLSDDEVEEFGEGANDGAAPENPTGAALAVPANPTTGQAPILDTRFGSSTGIDEPCLLRGEEEGVDPCPALEA